jgi:hypothetical protein
VKREAYLWTFRVVCAFEVFKCNLLHGHVGIANAGVQRSNYNTLENQHLRNFELFIWPGAFVGLVATYWTSLSDGLPSPCTLINIDSYLLIIYIIRLWKFRNLSHCFRYCAWVASACPSHCEVRSPIWNQFSGRTWEWIGHDSSSPGVLLRQRKCCPSAAKLCWCPSGCSHHRKCIHSDLHIT